MNQAPRAFIEDLNGEYRARIEQGLEFCRFFDNVPAGAEVFLKPNLTFPEYRPGVMTSYECIRAVTECLVDHGYRVTIGEADSGGYNRFSMDHVFASMGIHELCQRTGSRIVNLSFTEAEFLEVMTGMRRLRVPVPRLLLREIGAFITLPVPKIHMNTLVSMSIKNQWGCIQEPGERLKLHPYFAEVMFALNRQLPRAHSIIDGRFGLNRSGPMRGDAVELNWLMVSNDLVAADRLCCAIMQIDEQRVRYLRTFQRRGWWPDRDSVVMNQKIDRFKKIRFTLRSEWTDIPGLACFNSRFLAWLGYRSPLAGFAHWLLYLFREPFYDYSGEREKVQQRRAEGK